MSKSTMFIISWDSSVDEKLIEDKGIKSFSNYEDMKKYMDELIWEMRFSDLETDQYGKWIVDFIKKMFDTEKKCGLLHVENSYIFNITSLSTDCYTTRRIVENYIFNVISNISGSNLIVSKEI